MSLLIKKIKKFRGLELPAYFPGNQRLDTDVAACGTKGAAEPSKGTGHWTAGLLDFQKKDTDAEPENRSQESTFAKKP